MISICIPTYNQPEYLKRLLKSISIQTYKDYEIIITDDSPSNSVKLVVDQFKDLPIAYYKNDKALGSPGNWNKAISYAKGEYIKLIHHDDWFTSPESLEKFALTAKNNPNSDFIFSATKSYDDQSGEHSILKPRPRFLHKLKNNPKAIFPQNFIGSPSVCLVKSGVSTKFDQQFQWVVDIDYYLGVLTRNSSFLYIDEPLVCVTKNAASQVTSSSKNNKNLELREWINLAYKREVNSFALWYYLTKKYCIHSINELPECSEKIKSQFRLAIMLPDILTLLRKINNSIKRPHS